MKIAVDARYLNGLPSGIGRYSENLLRALLRLNHRDEWHVFVHPGYAPPPELRTGVVFHPVPWRPVSRATLLQIGSRIDALKCDLAHIHYPVIPLRLKTPLVVTFHDWQPLTDKSFSGGRPAPLKIAYDQFYRWTYPRAARIASAILNDSAATAADTARFAPLEVSKSHVVHLGLDDFFREIPSNAEVEQIKNHLALPDRYVLYVGTCRPHKQLPTLLEAFAELASVHTDLRLVLALSRDRFYSNIQALIDHLAIRDNIMIYENLSDIQLRAVYRKALVFAFPSKAEGFGFPLLEAMAQEVPCVINKAGSLPELGAGCALEVSPMVPNQLRIGLERVITDRSFAASLAKKGRIRALGFGWADTAAGTHKVFESLEV